MITLRPYQIEAIETIHDSFKTHQRQYIELPTGAGKTVTFLSYAHKYCNNVLILVPSKQLLKQVYSSALLFYDADMISRKGDKYDEKVRKVHICIINSMRGHYLNVMAQLVFDMIIIDEAHHSQSESYTRFIERREKYFESEHPLFNRYLGVTATPDRLDKKLIDNILNYKSYSVSIHQLIVQGYLCDIEGYRVNTNIDLSDVDDHNKDFSLRQLYNKLCVDSRNNLIVNCYKQHLKDSKTLLFAININHSKTLCKSFNSHGISCSHIDGTMNDIERFSILDSFRKGEISVLSNCQLLTEGFDEPSIDGIILARPTKSKSLFLQMIGRGLRISKGKTNCKIIDIVDNNRLLKSFNTILDACSFPEMKNFKGMKELEDHIYKETIKVTEYTIERSDFFESTLVDEKNATDSMIQYLSNNNILYFDPLSFDEASFLIWMNEIKKEYYNGNHC